jgi:FixJ family two-component response regulator
MGSVVNPPESAAQEARRVIIAVDDDFRVRESLESLMDSAGYAPVVFGSGADLLESGALARANFLITDVRLPGMNGIELQRRVRIQRPDLPVIFISAFQDEEIRQRALEGGALHFLYKPFDAAVLLRIIQSLSGGDTNLAASEEDKA